MPKIRQNVSKEDIKAMIWKRGSTLRQVSLHAGLCMGAATEALRVPFPAGNHAIAKFLGTSVHELWPCWYDQNGNRIHSQRHGQTVAHQNPSVSVKSAQAI